VLPVPPWPSSAKTFPPASTGSAPVGSPDRSRRSCAGVAKDARTRSTPPPCVASSCACKSADAGGRGLAGDVVLLEERRVAQGEHAPRNHPCRVGLGESDCEVVLRIRGVVDRLRPTAWRGGRRSGGGCVRRILEVLPPIVRFRSERRRQQRQTPKCQGSGLSYFECATFLLDKFQCLLVSLLR